MAKRVSLLKQSSTQQIELAMQKTKSLSVGGDVDGRMITDGYLAAKESMERAHERELRKLDPNDPNYEKNKAAIELQIKQGQFKTMKSLNKAFERVPAKVKSQMVKRKSEIDQRQN